MAIKDVNYNVTYDVIIDRFKLACDAHKAIASFDTGTIDFLDASSQKRLYPYIFLRPMASIVTDRVRTNSFELYSLDIPKAMKSQSNTELMSDTEMYIYDIMAYFNFNTYPDWRNWEIDITNCIPVNEGFQDRVFGWVGNIDVNTPFAFNYCDYPSYP